MQDFSTKHPLSLIPNIAEFSEQPSKTQIAKKLGQLCELFQIFAISELLILNGNFLEHTHGYENLTDWWPDPCTHFANSFR